MTRPISCDCCGHGVSPSAAACPACGHPTAVDWLHSGASKALRVNLRAVDVPFWQLVLLLVKLTVAAMPAFLIILIAIFTLIDLMSGRLPLGHF